MCIGLDILCGITSCMCDNDKCQLQYTEKSNICSPAIISLLANKAKCGRFKSRLSIHTEYKFKFALHEWFIKYVKLPYWELSMICL